MRLKAAKRAAKAAKRNKLPAHKGLGNDERIIRMGGEENSTEVKVETEDATTTTTVNTPDEASTDSQTPDEASTDDSSDSSDSE